MKLLKMLLQTTRDDLKDAEMLVGYAEKAKAMGRDDIAAMFLSRASRRINEDYPNGKRVFDDLMEKLRKEKGDAPDSAQGKCWEMLQEETDARVENVKNRIREIR